MILCITNQEDRRTLAGILVENGYRVELVRVKEGKVTRIRLKVEETTKNKEVKND